MNGWFTYPALPHVRKYAPAGHKDYAEYKAYNRS